VKCLVWDTFKVWVHHPSTTHNYKVTPTSGSDLIHRNRCRVEDVSRVEHTIEPLIRQRVTEVGRMDCII